MAFKTRTEMQADRVKRAKEQLPKYSFRRSGTAIAVTKRETKEVYVVRGEDCTCPDAEGTCRNVGGLVCKHAEMVKLTVFGRK